ncbi:MULTISPECIES: BamA/OMP85 family outer membrane protein [Culturomica]|uniref:BamA/OMP85 family outer membrane protein n=1 Tax=Culturomica TaxID=1926651 RepID=UPI000837F7C9|nr:MULTISPECIES: POTRA domain-containing protein [Culturomica]HBO27928.1 outer membrane protein assembly factor BamA [Culturomica sp.]
MIKRVILCFIITFLCGSGIMAQTTDSIVQPEVYYSSPKTYEIGGIEVTGIADHYDPETLVQLAGLKVGQEIKLPGDEITKAIKRLYSNGLFSDVGFFIDRVVDGKAYLILHLQERQKLSKINYIGLKKSEENKIKEKINPLPGTQVTDNMITNLKHIVEKHFKEKGFYNISIKALQRDDPEKDNFVILDVIVERNNKIKIQDIVINGNKEIKASVLKRAMKKTREKSLVNFFKSSKYIEASYEDDKYNLLDKYNEKGYRDAMILSDSVVQVSPKRVKIYINVEEGKKYYYNNITWVGNTVYDSERLSRILNIQKGDVYNKKYFNERLNDDENTAVNKLYVNNGYLFFRAIPVETVVGNDSINVEIRIFEGPQATINRVIIKGNDRTHEHVARRELYVYPGELFSREDVMRSYRELANLGHFDPEQIKPDVKPDPEAGTADVIFSVVEKANDRVELSGGWGAGMIIGSLGLTFTNFSIRNIFNWESYRPLPQGDGQTLSLKAQTNGKYYTSFSASFREPWLGGRKPNSLSVSAYYSRQTGYSSSYYNHSYYVNNSKDMYDDSQLMTTFGVSVGLGRRIKWPDDFFTMYTEVSYQRYHLKNWPYYIFSNGNSNNLSFAFQLKRSSIDNPLYTRKGSDFTFGLSFTLPYSWFDGIDYDKSNLEEKNRYRWIEYHKWKFIGKTFMPLDRNEKLVLYAGVQYGYLGYYNKHKRSPFEGFEMGGDGMSGYSLYGREYIGLRGYQNGSLTNAGSNFIAPNAADASLYSKWTMEVRYPISLAQSATIYALAFLEAGNSWYELKEFEPFNLYRSAGVGLRVFLPMFGLLGIDWGYGFDEVPGRPGAAGSQFHFVLGQEF